jgi:acyl dehydratase
MPIRSDAVGSKLGGRDVEVSARDILAYAAGIGATEPGYFDDAREGGIVAPPPFCVSLEWPVVRASAGANAYGASPEELLRGVHASQDSVFHRAIRVGDRLRVEGDVVGVRSTRAGALVQTRLETTDARTGEPVVTSWYGSMFRGVAVDGEPRENASPPPLATGDPDESQLESIEIPIAREAPHVYTECARIWNPIHTERTVALAAGLPDIILHGTATWALAARELVRRRAGGDPLRLRRLAGRFSAMVIPGTSIQVELGSARDELVHFRVRNAAGEVAIAQGVVELAAA